MSWIVVVTGSNRKNFTKEVNRRSCSEREPDEGGVVGKKSEETAKAK